jgi:hypothetical protein
MATKIIGGLSVAIVGCIVTAMIGIHRLENPSYETKHLEGPGLTLNYPSGWTGAQWGRANHADTAKEVYLRPRTYELEYREPFNTRWDKAEESLFWVEVDSDPKHPDPHDTLVSVQKQAQDWNRGEIKQTQFKGYDAWTLTQPDMPEALDIGLPRGPGFFKSIYLVFFGGQESVIHSVFRVGGKTYSVRYKLPGDKIARKRYERVYARMIDSLVIKG